MLAIIVAFVPCIVHTQAGRNPKADSLAIHPEETVIPNTTNAFQVAPARRTIAHTSVLSSQPVRVQPQN